MIAYEDLDLRIQTNGKGFAVVAQRGTQTARVGFNPVRARSLDLEEIESLGSEEIETLGRELFRALIHGDVRDLYQQARGASGSDANKGFCVRIMIDSRDRRLRPLLSVPWEILRDPSANANGLVALDRRRTIVRMIDSSEPPVEPATGKMARVLLALANPDDTDPLALAKERKQVEEALERNQLQKDVLLRATPSTLYDRISAGEPQIVHFMGHGLVDSRRGKGVILLEGKEGRERTSDALDASTFATFFAGRPMPRLVILNACRTASVGRARTFKAFASVAAALVAAGLPAVIAMQSVIRDGNAIRFTQCLYGALFRGVPIEGALSEARVAISARDKLTLDWAAPVLYMRAQRGRVLETREPAISPPPPLPSSSITIEKIEGAFINGDVGSFTQNLRTEK